jgi:hypothetical protein
MSEKKSAHEAISKLLVERIGRRKGEKLDKAACSAIYQDLFFTLSELVKTSGSPLSNESVNLLAQMYYDSVVINNNEELDPNIFTQRAKIENISTKELAFLATLTEGSPFFGVFVGAIKRRS